MVTVAEFTVPTAEVPSAAAFERLPGANIELERVIPLHDAIVPYAWVRGVEVEAVERVVEAMPDEKPHPDLREVVLVDVVDGDVLLRLVWEREVRGLLGAIADSDVVLISGDGTAERWRIEVRSEDRAAVSAFQARCVDNGVPVELRALHALARVRSGSGDALTDAQREALVLAYERGYFQSPRESSLEEIAGELGITGQSLGSRIRRGIERLVADAVVDADAGEG